MNRKKTQRLYGEEGLAVRRRRSRRRIAVARWAATGDGVVDWPTLDPLFATTPADHLVVEHDEPADWRNIAQRSIDYLRRLQVPAESGN